MEGDKITELPTQQDTPDGSVNKFIEVQGVRDNYDIERIRIKYEDVADTESSTMATSEEDSALAAKILQASRALWVNDTDYKDLDDDEKYVKFLDLMKMRLRRDLKAVLGPDLYLQCMSRQMILSYKGGLSNHLKMTQSKEAILDSAKVAHAFNRVNEMHAIEDWMGMAGDKTIKFVDYFRYVDGCNILTRSSYVHHMWFSGFKYLAQNNTQKFRDQADEDDRGHYDDYQTGERKEETTFERKKRTLYEERMKDDEMFLKVKFSRADWFRGQMVPVWDHVRTVRNHNVFNSMDQDEDGFINPVEWCVNEWRYLVNFKRFGDLETDEQWQMVRAPTQDDRLRNNGYYALVSKEIFLEANKETFRNPIIRRVMLHGIGFPKGLRLVIMDPHGRMRPSAFAGVRIPVWWKLGITAVDEYRDNLASDASAYLLEPIDWTKEVREGSIEGRIPELPF